MEGAQGPYVARTPEEVFRDYRGRRAGMIKALTTGTNSDSDLVQFLNICFLFSENFANLFTWENFSSFFM
jgi:Alfin